MAGKRKATVTRLADKTRRCALCGEYKLASELAPGLTSDICVPCAAPGYMRLHDAVRRK